MSEQNENPIERPKLFNETYSNRLLKENRREVSFHFLNTYYYQGEEVRRVMCVEAALNLLGIEANAGIKVGSDRGPSQAFKNIDLLTSNPVKQYADWIEDALKIERSE